MFPGPGDQKDFGRYLAMGQVGMEMAAPIALGAVIDSYFHCSPWGVSVGAAIGFIGGFAQLVRMANKRPTPTGRDRAAPTDEVRPGENP
jgi:F0F1-type ATP synthase assembly protein I